MTDLTESERNLLQDIRRATDNLAQMLHSAVNHGFQIQFNINAQAGQCDMFKVYRLQPVDLKKGSN